MRNVKWKKLNLLVVETLELRPFPVKVKTTTAGRTQQTMSTVLFVQ